MFVRLLAALSERFPSFIVQHLCNLTNESICTTCCDQIGWMRKELRYLKQTDPAVSSSGRVAEATAAAASMVSAELQVPLRWSQNCIPGGMSNGDQALSSVRLLQDLEKACAVRLPPSANAAHIFSVLLQHGLDMRKSSGTDSQWQAIEPRLEYLLKISPGTALSVEPVVKKLAYLFIENITTVDWASYDRNGEPIAESERKIKPVSCRYAGHL